MVCGSGIFLIWNTYKKLHKPVAMFLKIEPNFYFLCVLGDMLKERQKEEYHKGILHGHVTPGGSHCAK